MLTYISYRKLDSETFNFEYNKHKYNHRNQSSSGSSVISKTVKGACEPKVWEPTLWCNSWLNRRGRLVTSTIFICGFLSGLKFFDLCLPRSSLPSRASCSLQHWSRFHAPLGTLFSGWTSRGHPGLAWSPDLLSPLCHSLITWLRLLKVRSWVSPDRRAPPGTSSAQPHSITKGRCPGSTRPDRAHRDQEEVYTRT